ncbi:MAG: hypothetical protein ABSH36_11745 [Solirubrobacteraceae bacterium]
MPTGERYAQRWRRLFGRASCLAGLSASLALLAASSATGSTLYYQSGGAIDRLDLSGAQRPHQIAGSRAVGDGVSAMAVSGPYLYWSDFNGLDHSSIWRARLDGGGARALIHVPSSGPHGPVIAGGHIYWSETNAIARANLNGSHAQRTFKRLPLQSSGEATNGLATDGRYIYFSRCQDAEIGRIALNGSEANPHFIALARGQCPQGIAVAGGRIYWTNLGLEGPGTIGRASLAGGGEATDGWLAMPPMPAGGPWSLAAAGGQMYFSWGGTPESAPTYIGTAALEGPPAVSAQLVRVARGGTAIVVVP